MSINNPANPLSHLFTGSPSNITFEGSLPSVTLQANAWDESNEQTVTAPGVLADESKQIILSAPASIDQDAFYAAGIRIISQSVDSVTFRCNNVPEEDLTVYVAVMKPKVDDGGSSEEVYSEEEVRIGTWIDGKPLYRKTLHLESARTDAKIADMDPYIKSITNMYGTLEDSYGYSYNIPVVHPGGVLGVLCKVSDHTIHTATNNSTSFGNRPLTLTLEYTKTTDE